MCGARPLQYRLVPVARAGHPKITSKDSEKDGSSAKDPPSPLDLSTTPPLGRSIGPISARSVVEGLNELDRQINHQR